MTSVRRCDACGGVGEEPYDGWLKIVSYAKSERGSALLDLGHPLISYDVCGHACLPTLAFEKAGSFVEAAR